MANHQTVYHSDSSLNAIIKTELTDAREEFLTLVASLSNADFKRKSNVSVWTSKELLVHIVFWLQQTPRAVTLVRTGKRLPRLPGSTLCLDQYMAHASGSVATRSQVDYRAI